MYKKLLFWRCSFLCLSMSVSVSVASAVNANVESIALFNNLPGAYDSFCRIGAHSFCDDVMEFGPCDVDLTDMKNNNEITDLMYAAAKGQNIAALHKQSGVVDQYGRTALAYAAYTGNLAAVKTLFSDVNEHKCRGKTPLMYAAERGHVEVVKFFLEYETFVNKYDDRGMTALMHAACAGHKGVVAELLQSEANKKDTNGLTALMYAARYGHLDVVKLLLANEAGKQDNNGMTALMHAACAGHKGVVAELLQSEANKKDTNGLTALMYAARYGHLDVVKLLLANEAGKQDNNGMTALMHAACAENNEVAKLLIPREAKMQDNSGKTAMMYAVEKWNRESVVDLSRIESGIQCKNGYTALKYAVSNGMSVTYTLSGEYVKDDSYKNSLLYCAVNSDAGFLQIINLFYNCPGERDWWKEAVLDAAQKSKIYALYNLLRIKEYSFLDDWNCEVSDSALSALTQVISSLSANSLDKNSILVIDILCRYIDESQKTVVMNTFDEKNLADAVCMHAAEFGCKHLVELLVDQSIDKRDSNGVGVLEHAVQSGNAEIVKSIIEKKLQTSKGVDVSEIEKAFFCAVGRGNTQCADILLSQHDSIKAPVQKALLSKIHDKLNIQSAPRQPDEDCIKLEKYVDVFEDVLQKDSQNQTVQDCLKAMAQHVDQRSDKNVLLYAYEREEMHRLDGLLCEQSGRKLPTIKNALQKELHNKYSNELVQLGIGEGDAVLAAFRDLLEEALLMQQSQANIRQWCEQRLDTIGSAYVCEDPVYVKAMSYVMQYIAETGHVMLLEEILRYAGLYNWANGSGQNNMTKLIYDVLDDDFFNKTSKNEKIGCGLQCRRNKIITHLVFACNPQYTQQRLRYLKGEDKKEFNISLAMEIRNENISTLHRLLQYYTSDGDDVTALMYAAGAGNINAVELLISREAQMQDKEGKTALMYAASVGNTDVVKLLISREAQMQDKEGKTALMYAASVGNTAVVDILISLEANMRDNQGKTALMYAERARKFVVANVLRDRDGVDSQSIDPLKCCSVLRESRFDDTRKQGIMMSVLNFR